METKKVSVEELEQKARNSEEVGEAVFSVRKNGLVLMEDMSIPTIFAPNLVAALRERANYIEKTYTDLTKEPTDVGN